MPRMTRLGLLILPTMLLTGCESVNFNFNVGGETPTTEVQDSPETDAASCVAYHPIPDSVKRYMAKMNDTDPAINPWAGWLLGIRNWLEQGCP